MRIIDGLIPARAGNTAGAAWVSMSAGAHPRSRGEHHDHYRRRCRHRGSSPLARGTLASTVDIEARAGLIPARAGNTDVKDRSINGDRAHPRSRGEHCGRQA